MKPTKFHGKFKDLIPAGFKFQKLFARNYRVYSLIERPYSSESIEVWQQKGGSVEINDIGYYSYLIFEAFSKPEELEKYLQLPYYCGEPYYKFVLNRETNELEIYNREIHDSMLVFLGHENGNITEEERNAKILHLRQTYREIIIYKDSWLQNAIEMMLKKEFVIV